MFVLIVGFFDRSWEDSECDVNKLLIYFAVKSVNMNDEIGGEFRILHNCTGHLAF